MPRPRCYRDGAWHPRAVAARAMTRRGGDRRCETRDPDSNPRRPDARRPPRRPRPDRGPHRHHGCCPLVGERPCRARRTDRGGRAGCRGPTADRPVDAGHRAPRAHRDARLPGRARPSDPRRSGDAPLRPARRRGVRAWSRRHRRLRAIASRRDVDPRWRVVHGRLRGRDAAARGPRPDRPRPSGLPDEPRRPRGVGELEGARAGRDHRGDARSRGRPHRTRPRRLPLGHAPRGGDGPGPAADARRHPRGAGGGPAAGPAPSPRVRGHGMAGRHRRAARRGARLRRAGEPRRADRAGWSAPCGGTTIAAPTRSRSSWLGERPPRSGGTHPPA